MKEMFEKAEVETIEFDNIDIITSSNDQEDPFQPPLQPGFEEDTDIE